LARRKKPNTNINPNSPSKKSAEDLSEDFGDDGDGGGRGDNEEDGGVIGMGPNWIERSFPLDTIKPSSSAKDLKSVEDYNLGISGISFQTGRLSKRMYDVIMTKSQFADNPNDDIKKAFTLCAMDFTAKEATKAALKQNGLEIALAEDEEAEGMWGDLDSIRLLDPQSEEPIPGKLYDSTEEAIDEGGWTPGQPFDFVVRQVPAKIKELSLDELIQALDPNGELRQQAKEANMTLPDEDIKSLVDLANDNVRRTEMASRGATTEQEAFTGYPGAKRGYTPIQMKDLCATVENGTPAHDTMMHVMNSFVAHGALVVDLTNGGTDFELAKEMANMWKAIDFFYNGDIDNEKRVQMLPPMTTIMDTGSATAVAGYASYDADSMQFLETRRNRKTKELLPAEVSLILGEDATSSLRSVFDAVSEAGKRAVQVAVFASTSEAGAFVMNEDPEESAATAATLLVNELLDDGSESVGDGDYPICMSPHRLCRYTNNQASQLADEEEAEEQQSSSREVFGAHVDSTWVTAVPAAAVSGLEVFDETEEEWLRPELAAKLFWQEEQKKRGQNPSSFFETIPEAGEALPWHSRYVVLMPGELLQLATRNEVPAAVHRVVHTKYAAPRLSAPILLRCRPGVKMNVQRYLGDSDGDPLLQQCNNMTIEEIHAALQPTSFQ